MISDVLMSRDFDQAFQQLSSQKRQIVKRKIDYMVTNPAHSSLNLHRLKQADGDIWDCRIDDQGMRLLYEIQQHTLRLWYLGGHALVDHVQRLSFNQRGERGRRRTT